MKENERSYYQRCFFDDLEIIERYIILFLGVIDKPIPSILHLEKELFILSKANPKVSSFIKFIKHYYGPYSDDVRELEKPIYNEDAYEYDGKKIWITSRGKEIFNELVNDYGDTPKFKEMLGMIKMIRELYEKLSTEELLFLVYLTYPEYREKSRISDNLLSKEKRTKIGLKLLKKGLITKERYLKISKICG